MLMQAVNVYFCCKVVHFTKESVTESLLSHVDIRGPAGFWSNCTFSISKLVLDANKHLPVWVYSDLVFAIKTWSSDKSCLLCPAVESAKTGNFVQGDVWKDDVRVFCQTFLIEEKYTFMFMSKAFFVLHWAPALAVWSLCMSECDVKLNLIWFAFNEKANLGSVFYWFHVISIISAVWPHDNEHFQ